MAEHRWGADIAVEYSSLFVLKQVCEIVGLSLRLRDKVNCLLKPACSCDNKVVTQWECGRK